MTDNLKLPSWLSRGIEEYFPIKGTDQTFSEIIDHAKKNNKKLKYFFNNCKFKYNYYLVVI